MVTRERRVDEEEPADGKTSVKELAYGFVGDDTAKGLASNDHRGGFERRERCDVAASHLFYAGGLRGGAQEVWVVEGKNATIREAWRIIGLVGIVFLV